MGLATPEFVVTPGPIDARALEAAVLWPGAGAALSFTGVVRDSFGGEAVTGLSYEAYTPLCAAVWAEIVAEAAARWPGARLAGAHRTGDLAVGEVAVVVSVAAPHRDEAYAASRYAMEALKARLPVWKKEHTVSGSHWKPNTPPPEHTP
jgi:molybdopterin synthase catalytic subunit